MIRPSAIGDYVRPDRLDFVPSPPPRISKTVLLHFTSSQPELVTRWRRTGRAPLTPLRKATIRSTPATSMALTPLGVPEYGVHGHCIVAFRFKQLANEHFTRAVSPPSLCHHGKMATPRPQLPQRQFPFGSCPAAIPLSSCSTSPNSCNVLEFL